MGFVRHSTITDAGIHQRTERLFDLLGQGIASAELQEKAIELIKQGIDLTAVDWNGKTILYRVADHGYTEVMRLLLERGADIAARDDEGSTVLHTAAISDDTKMILLLLASGASVWAKNKSDAPVVLSRQIYSWSPQLKAFLRGQFEPKTVQDWLGLASVMPLKDPYAYSSVKERVEQLMDWHKGLKALRSQAASPTIGELEV